MEAIGDKTEEREIVESIVNTTHLETSDWLRCVISMEVGKTRRHFFIYHSIESDFTYLTKNYDADFE